MRTLQHAATRCITLQHAATHCTPSFSKLIGKRNERWGAGVETQKNVLGVFVGWGRVPFNEPYAPSLSTIYDGA